MRRIAIVGTLMTAVLAGGQAFANHPPDAQADAQMEIAAQIQIEAAKVKAAFEAAQFRDYDGDGYDDRDRRRYRRPHRGDEKGWQLLGQTQVRRRGYDEIDLGREYGRFTRIMFAVDHGRAFVRGVRITFANGDTYEPEVYGRLDRDQPAITIDLPGDARKIEKIEFFARGGRWRDSATLNVWGERIERQHRHPRRGGWY
jgi:hypothetical protein